MSDRPLVEARGLGKEFPLSGGGFGRREVVHAVQDVDLVVGRGETLGVIGESGCGKSTLGRLLLRLIEPTHGQVFFDGRDLATLGSAALRALRREMQIVFQDPFASLDPRMRVGAIIAEGLEVHGLASGDELGRRVAELLSEVGLRPEHAERYPHEFSGGQRQRIGIARALAVSPRFLVLDEPVSALDVSVQAQVVNLLADLQRSRGLSYFFVAHDLRVVAHLSHRIAILYLGRIVEIGERETILTKPAHPYTRALLDAVPEPGAARPAVLGGDLPSPLRPPGGCAFHPRCAFAQPSCREVRPALREVADGQRVACDVLPFAAGVAAGEQSSKDGAATGIPEEEEAR